MTNGGPAQAGSAMHAARMDEVVGGAGQPRHPAHPPGSRDARVKKRKMKFLLVGDPTNGPLSHAMVKM